MLRLALVFLWLTVVVVSYTDGDKRVTGRVFYVNYKSVLGRMTLTEGRQTYLLKEAEDKLAAKDEIIASQSGLINTLKLLYTLHDAKLSELQSELNEIQSELIENNDILLDFYDDLAVDYHHGGCGDMFNDTDIDLVENMTDYLINSTKCIQINIVTEKSFFKQRIDQLLKSESVLLERMKSHEIKYEQQQNETKLLGERLTRMKKDNHLCHVSLKETQITLEHLKQNVALMKQRNKDSIQQNRDLRGQHDGLQNDRRHQSAADINQADQTSLDNNKRKQPDIIVFNNNQDAKPLHINPREKLTSENSHSSDDTNVDIALHGQLETLKRLNSALRYKLEETTTELEKLKATGTRDVI